MSGATSRVLDLLGLLQTHRQWSGPELSRRLGVTERTLRRDVERLRELGYRVDATRGLAGGYRLAAGAQLPPLLLNDDEAVAVAVGLRLAATQGLVDGEQTTLSALAKFEQLLPKALRRRVNALGEHVRPAHPRGGGVSPELLGQLALACRDTERVRFRYLAADGAETDRQAEPLSVVAAGRAWYLVCWDVDRRDWRTFRIDRIARLQGTGLRFRQRDAPAGDPVVFVQQSLRNLFRRVTAELVIDLPVAAVHERFGSWARGAVAVDGGRTRLPIDGEALESLLMYLVWIPVDVGYEIHGNDELVALAATIGARLQRHGAPAVSAAPA
ncbi:helix-turn-helix transcriptional regulator [Nakamurella deserti]|uniref:helix-turn-helix transcriptional regulator n=1 Tax=Nakamurella deserti TaxID=2164074 RepID=UPI000DBE03F0|nr:YafY family protein [Nakamurella deserti]